MTAAIETAAAAPSIRSQAVRFAQQALGVVCVAFGVVGIFIPLMPSTTFFILAAVLFARSSPRLQAAILRHPTVGPPVRDFLDHRVVPVAAKVAAGLMLTISVLVAAWASAPIWAIGAILVVAAAVMAYILPKPTRRPQEAPCA